MLCYGELALLDALTQGAPVDGSFPWAARQLARAVGRRRLGRGLLRLTLSSAAWRRVETATPGPLHGLHVAMTGVMEVLGGDGADSHAALRSLISRWGGCEAAAVTRGGTDILIVGRGEKGEGGVADGKGLAAETSRKYLDAVHCNGRTEADGLPPITLVYEDELFPFLLSARRQALVEARGQRGRRPSAIGPRDATRPPAHAPDCRAVRFTSIAQQAHGRGDPGGPGAILADALAAPSGFSLASALVTAQSMSSMFVWTMLQTASVADGAPPRPLPGGPPHALGGRPRAPLAGRRQR